jgi:outer membrane protein
MSHPSDPRRRVSRRRRATQRLAALGAAAWSFTGAGVAQQPLPAAEPPPSVATTVPGAPANAGAPLSLEEALRLAAESSETIRLANADIARADAVRRQARSFALPQVQGSGGYNRTLASEFEDIDLDFGGDGGGEALGDLPFGQVNQYRLGLTFQQVLWAGGRIAGQVGAATAGVRAAEERLDGIRASLALDVTRAYFDALLADRLVQITVATLEQAEEAYRQTKLAFDVGNQSEFDLLRAQVARDNQEPELVQRRADRDLAYLQLEQLVGLPAGATPQLTTGFADFALWEQGPKPPPPAERQAWVEAVVEERTPVAQARNLVEAREQLLRSARGERWPNIGLSSDYGRVAYPGSGVPGWDDMRTNWTVGVGFGIPVFTGGRVQARIAEAKSQVDDAEARLDQVRELASLDARDALERLAAADAVWEASAGNVEQAQRAYEIAELRYREGISTQLELSDARLLLQQAQATRARSARNLQIARARVALLPDLPLSSTGDISGPANTLTTSAAVAGTPTGAP